MAANGEIVDMVSIKSLRYKEIYGANVEEANTIVESWQKVEYEAWKQKLAAQEKVLAQREALIKKYPKFWLTALTNFANLSSFMVAEDREALEALEDLKIIHKEDPRYFDIVLTFKENPFFSNTTLVKSYSLTPADNVKLETPAAPVPKYSLEAETYTSPTPIDWKSEDKNLVKKYPAKNIDDMEEFDEVPDQIHGSFFNYFTSGEDGQDPYNFAEMFNVVYEQALDLFAGVYVDSDLEDGEDHSEDEEDDDDASKEIDLDEEEEKRSKKRQRTN
ncbi:hypothetical protein BT69DRAFT_1292519 [Atractiella rhizophila]|nr:hypothetical protein BT69DRAFT_1292519 [Atractiella rhizophila]